VAADRVRIVDACKNFGKVVALKNANLNVHPGEVVLIIGPSGSGKSTMLRCVNRLEHLTSGQIWIDDDQVTDRASDMRKIREEVGMVFQSFNLFPHLTALQNITLAPRVVKRIPRPRPPRPEKPCWPGSASPKRPRSTPSSSRAVSSSAWPSPGPSP
jgi:ABC-type polar amino acid transport system ATPase subunit